MVNRDLVTLKLAELEDRVARVRAHVPARADQLATSRDALDLVAFNLMLAVQACVDVAGHVIADSGWIAPQSLGEAFIRLRDHGVISQAVASALMKAVGLRNVVAHGYAKVDVPQVFMAATAGTTDLEAFASEVARYLDAQPVARA